MKDIFKYDLEKERERKGDCFGRFCVIYYNTENGGRVDVGDSLGHVLTIERKHWNSIIRLIKSDRLYSDEISALVFGLMEKAVGEYGNNLVRAIKEGEIKEFRYDLNSPK